MTPENKGILSDAQIEEIRQRHAPKVTPVIEPSLTKAELLELIAIRLRDPKTPVRVFGHLSSQFMQLTKPNPPAKPGTTGRRPGRPRGSKNKYKAPPTVMDLVNKMEASQSNANSGSESSTEISQA